MPTENATDQQDYGDTDQQSTDYAGEADPGVAEGEQEEGAASADSESESEDVELLPQDLYDSLKGNPEQLRKELNRAATKKFQTLARERQELEPYREFLHSLDIDPQGAVRALAAQLGMSVNAGEPLQRQQVMRLEDAVRNDLASSLGEEYGDLVDRLAPGIQRIVERVASEIARPLRAQQDQLVRESAQRESAAAVSIFEKGHPDFKRHETAMVELSKKLHPQPGMNEQEYMEVLYTAVTARGAEGDAAKRLVNRINKSSRSDSGGNRVSSREVRADPTRPPTFEEAAAAARRGESWDQ